MRAPLAPTGCPKAIAPPLTFVIDRSKPSSLITLKACAPNASFASINSISSTVISAFFNAFCVEGIGPVPIICGSTPPIP